MFVTMPTFQCKILTLCNRKHCTQFWRLMLLNSQLFPKLTSLGRVSASYQHLKQHFILANPAITHWAQSTEALMTVISLSVIKPCFFCFILSACCKKVIGNLSLTFTHLLRLLIEIPPLIRLLSPVEQLDFISSVGFVF